MGVVVSVFDVTVWNRHSSTGTPVSVRGRFFASGARRMSGRIRRRSARRGQALRRSDQ